MSLNKDNRATHALEGQAQVLIHLCADLVFRVGVEAYIALRAEGPGLHLQGSGFEGGGLGVGLGDNLSVQSTWSLWLRGLGFRVIVFLGAHGVPDISALGLMYQCCIHICTHGYICQSSSVV